MPANMKRTVLPSIHTYYTNDRLNYISFNYDTVLKIFQSLDPNKAHGHDGASVRNIVFHLSQKHF